MSFTCQPSSWMRWRRLSEGRPVLALAGCLALFQQGKHLAGWLGVFFTFLQRLERFFPDRSGEPRAGNRRVEGADPSEGKCFHTLNFWTCPWRFSATSTRPVPCSSSSGEAPWWGLAGVDEGDAAGADHLALAVLGVDDQAGLLIDTHQGQARGSISTRRAKPSAHEAAAGIQLLAALAVVPMRDEDRQPYIPKKSRPGFQCSSSPTL